jgi:hypothetical protein
LTFDAKRREQRLSLAYSLAGLTFTNISVLASPPREGCGGREGRVRACVRQGGAKREGCALAPCF